jgi:mono/diheme cytochrome c family protein
MQSIARWRTAAVVRNFLARVATLSCAAILGAAIATACGKPRQLSAVARGEVIYRTNCASCHNLDPNLPGSIGPAIAGSSRALLDARVLHAAYPPGYRPQRKTHTMRPLPWLNGHMDDLAAFLAAARVHHSG